MRFSIKLLLMLVAVLGIAGASSWLALGGSATAIAALKQSNGEESARPAVPVFAATVEAKDMPIIVRGIGSVQAYNTVTVKSRVDGNILKVAFTEGQFVHQGDLLMQVDPRPYQAQLARCRFQEGCSGDQARVPP